jgi:hypothetical protein
MWWDSIFTKSYLGLPLSGIGVMGLSVLGNKFFTELMNLFSRYLTVSTETNDLITSGFRVFYYIGGAMLIIGIVNLNNKR